MHACRSTLEDPTKLAGVGGGGTSCSAPLAELNRRGASVDLVVFVSDNESWVDPRVVRGTALLAEWQRLKARCPAARMVCIDIQPNRTTQAEERADVLNVGGFSDAVFDLVADFARGGLEPGRWTRVIESVVI